MMRLPFYRPVNHRKLGNAARAVRDWEVAATEYRLHLEAHPDDAPIHVQLGHALKEQGRLAEAAAAYERATGFPGQQIEGLVHLADLLHRDRRFAEALAAYRRLHALNGSADAWAKIVALRQRPGAAPAEIGDNPIFFTIQDLFGYLKAHVTMSGIQRVQAGIATHAMTNPAVNAHFILNERPGQASLSPGEFWLLDNGDLQAAIDYASGTVVDHERLRDMLLACESTVTRVKPAAGSTIMLLGAFWGLGNGVDRLIHARRDGVLIGAYIYDIIPVTHPEFCDAALVVDFTKAVCEICFLVDFMFTISVATKVAIEEFLERHGGRRIPVTAVPLAHELTTTMRAAPIWPAALASLKGRPYALYVSTVEGRKNHLYVVNAWRRLMKEGVKVPDLVFVGRKGWRIAGLTDLLEATGNAEGRIHIVHDLSDGELHAVYADCLFTLFTSFVEGWGLPVGESLVHGRPCIASSVSSIPEVGGRFVDYVDPYDLNDGVRVIRRMIEDTRYRQEREDAIRTSFQARSWKDVAEDFMTRIEEARRSIEHQPRQLDVIEGRLCWLDDSQAHQVELASYFALPERLLIDSSSLNRPEPGGSWLKGKTPHLQFTTGLDSGSKAFVYLKMIAAPWADGCSIAIVATAGEDEALAVEEPVVVACTSLRIDGGIRCPATVGSHGMISLRIEVTGDYTPPVGEVRDFVVGVQAIGYAGVANRDARQDLLENFAFRHAAASRWH